MLGVSGGVLSATTEMERLALIGPLPSSSPSSTEKSKLSLVVMPPSWV